MEHDSSASLRDRDLHRILAALEVQLASLDEAGAHLAAAHLDAAIQQIRLDQARRASGPNKGFA